MLRVHRLSIDGVSLRSSNACTCVRGRRDKDRFFRSSHRHGEPYFLDITRAACEGKGTAAWREEADTELIFFFREENCIAKSTLVEQGEKVPYDICWSS